MSPEDVVREAWALLGRGQADQALARTAPLAAVPAADAPLLIVHAAALKALDRHAEAAAFNQRAVERTPGDRLAWYNLAATLGDLGRAEEGEAAMRRAMELGLDAPEAWLVLGRALQFQHRYDEAETAYRAALARRETYADAHHNLAQLRWMRTGDLDQATAALTSAMTRHPADGALARTRAVVEEFAGDKPAALATLNAALRRQPGDILLLIAAAHMAAETGDAEAAVTHAEAAVRLAPTFPPALAGLCEAYLAAGQARAADQIAERLRVADPRNPVALTLRATAWRLAGDPRHRQLNDHAGLVRAYDLPVPPGWDDLPSFLAALRARLLELHDLKTHPLQQSLRGGSQVQSLHTSDEPLFVAFFDAVRIAVRRYLDQLGPGADPFRARMSDDFKVSGGWSVLLRPDGFHADHFHPAGWISSAFYIDVPAEADDVEAKAGWLRFGRPGCATTPPLDAEHFVRPRPGLLALFPSYMWHGTVPFRADERRLTMAFDVVPVP
jgi:tetratricopeptide (TPR) repeat protein